MTSHLIITVGYIAALCNDVGRFLPVAVALQMRALVESVKLGFYTEAFHVPIERLT